jgi:methyltransferase (TIGR00027 family)
VERFRSGARPRSLREAVARGYQGRQAQVMALRTAAIDEALRQAAHEQVVILGAGLDGRAWRMPELEGATVFEVDHPDTQRAKQARVGALTATAREIRFVPVDFSRDPLEAALAGAGHDPKRPTTWIWEGVVMYLTLAEIEATLEVIAQRSAAGSRLVVLYHCPSVLLHLVGWFVRRMGEPLRSVFTPESMAGELRRHGFEAVRDEDLPALAARLGPALSGAVKPIRHLRVVTADRRAPPG